MGKSMLNDMLFSFFQGKKESRRVTTRGIRRLEGWNVYEETSYGHHREFCPTLPEARSYANAVGAKLIKAVYRPVSVA